jgi:hypothetical protein
MDAVVAADADGDEAQTVHDLLACKRTDPATLAAKRLDWSAFLARLKPAQRFLVASTAAGWSGLEQARELGLRACFRIEVRRQPGGDNSW